MIKKFFWLLLLLPTVAMAGFGASGNKVNYLDEGIKLDYTGHGSVAVAMQDLRPYIVNGEKKPEFVGQMRGGFGNPFQVKTQTGHPLGDDIAASIVAALHAAGFSATASSAAPTETPAQAAERVGKSTPDRIMVIQLRDWKTDTYIHTKLHYDVTISVYDHAGTLLDSITDEADRDFEVKASFSTKPMLAEIARNYREKLIGWLNDQKIRTALGGAPVESSTPATTP
jgi:hypothetical protein